MLRRPVADALVAKVARQNGIIAAAVFVPESDFPILTLNQLRLVLRLAAAYGQGSTRSACRRSWASSAPGSASARSRGRHSASIPFAGWAIQGGVAYTGTRAIGEAAIRYFEARSGGSRTETGAASADRA